MTKSLIFSLLLLTFLSSPSFAHLHINMPFGLRQWWENNSQGTHVSIASFGDIPWGKKISGRVGLADPLDACSFLRLKEDAQHVPSILLAMRGNCPFYLKAHYAQLAGAKLLLIVDNAYEEVELKLMVDSAGQGESIHIPSVLLAKQGGDKIIETLQDKNPQVNTIIAGFDFEIPKGDRVEYHLWLTSSNTQSFRFLRDWKKYADTLSNDTTSKIHFGHFRTFGADSANVENCVCGGRYCSTDPDGDLSNTGADVVQEDLRQLCILRKNSDTSDWWKYIQEYRDSCLSGGDMKQCSHQAMIKAGIDPTEIEECVSSSFIGTQDPKQCESNKLLDIEEELQGNDGTFMFPSVVINNFIYRGNLVPAKGVYEAVCEGFNNMPEACNTHFETISELPGVTTSHWPVVLTALIFLTVFSLFVFCCYKRYIANQMYKQGIREVNMAVSQYIAFKDNENDREDAD